MKKATGRATVRIKLLKKLADPSLMILILLRKKPRKINKITMVKPV